MKLIDIYFIDYGEDLLFLPDLTEAHALEALIHFTERTIYKQKNGEDMFRLLII